MLKKHKASLPNDTNQKRTVGMMMERSDFDTLDQDNPFTKMASNLAKLDRCVKKVKKSGGAKNPYAVCNASMNP